MTATAALVLAVGGGGVYAGTLVTGHDVKNGSLTGRDVKNGSLLRKDLERGQVPSAKSVAIDGSQPLTLKSSDGWVTVAQLSTTTKTAGVFSFTGAVEEASTSKTDPGIVALQIVHNGHIHPLASRTTVGPGQSEVGLALFSCDEEPGAQTMLLQAQVTGADIQVGARSFAVAEAAALP